MNLKLKTSEALTAGGGAIVFIFAFFSWMKVSFEGYGDTANAFEFFWTGTLPWILLSAGAVATVLRALGKMKTASNRGSMIQLLTTALATLLILIRVTFNTLEAKDLAEGLGADISRGFGLYIATIGALVALGGVVMSFQESGGNLKDLTDIDKLKGTLGSDE